MRVEAPLETLLWRTVTAVEVEIQGDPREGGNYVVIQLGTLTLYADNATLYDDATPEENAARANRDR